MSTTTKRVNSPLSQLLKTDPGLGATPKQGDLIQATLIEQAKRAAYFDLGRFGTGVVYGREFMNAHAILKSIAPGTAISAKVIDSENEEGYVELSLTEAGKQKAWEEVKDLKDRGEPIAVKITGANWGGLTTHLNGLAAFLPVSQLSNEHYPRIEDANKGKIAEELKKFVGQELKVKIIDVKPRANKLILSEKELNEANVKELLGQYSVGTVIDGIISGVADFGAFIRFADNPTIEGLIHISELDHRLIENPKEIVKIGDAVQAKITEIKGGRVSLSLKALKLDPWLKAEELYHAGDEVEGTITRFNPFGAFVGLAENLQGLIHVSEFGGVEEMKRELELGHIYSFRVEFVKAAEKRIILKLKRAHREPRAMESLPPAVPQTP